MTYPNDAVIERLRAEKEENTLMDCDDKPAWTCIECLDCGGQSPITPDGRSCPNCGSKNVDLSNWKTCPYRSERCQEC